MNTLEEQDSYWVANTFIWSWILLPSLPLADLLKQDVGTAEPEKRMSHKRKLSGYLAVSALIFAAWAVSYPLWPVFIEVVLKAAKVGKVLVGLYTLCYKFSHLLLDLSLVDFYFGVSPSLSRHPAASVKFS